MCYNSDTYHFFAKSTATTMITEITTAMAINTRGIVTPKTLVLEPTDLVVVIGVTDVLAVVTGPTNESVYKARSHQLKKKTRCVYSPGNGTSRFVLIIPSNRKKGPPAARPRELGLGARARARTRARARARLGLG